MRNRPLDKRTDEDLMQLVANDNLDVMELLFDRYYAKIFNFILKAIGDRSLSEDVAQETFYKALKHRKTYKQHKFSTWLYTIAKNLCFDHYKTNKSKLSLEAVNLSDHNGFEEDQEAEYLQFALQQLSLEDRQLLIMNRYQGIKYAEIAEITDSTAGAVRIKVHRALRKLRTHYFKNL